MGNHVGTVGKRSTFRVTYLASFNYSTHYTYYGEKHYIHKFVDADKNVIVWNTTSPIGKEIYDENGNDQWMPVFENSVLDLTGTVKEHSEYKGEAQTVLQRCKFVVIENGESPEAIKRRKQAEREAQKQAQLDSLSKGDIIYLMPYKQYKEHYSDCETVLDSFRKVDGRYSEISVIVRAGRLKKSGVRGEHYHGWEFSDGNGGHYTLRAISEETARKRLIKEYPDSATWELTHIYNYNIQRDFLN